jgi:hypothetical protein
VLQFYPQLPLEFREVNNALINAELATHLTGFFDGKPTLWLHIIPP